MISREDSSNQMGHIQGFSVQIADMRISQRSMTKRMVKHERSMNQHENQNHNWQVQQQDNGVWGHTQCISISRQ